MKVKNQLSTRKNVKILEFSTLTDQTGAYLPGKTFTAITIMKIKEYTECRDKRKDRSAERIRLFLGRLLMMVNIFLNRDWLSITDQEAWLRPDVTCAF